MAGLEYVIVVLLGIIVGTLIGCVGIGGVLLVPALTNFLELPVHTSISVAMFAYIFSGSVGTIIFARHGTIKWREARWIIVGAAPAALAGAILSNFTPGIGLEFLLAILIVLAGFNALKKKRLEEDFNVPHLSVTVLICVGAITGFFSAMSGTGGPLVLVPLTVWLGFPALTAVGLSQAAQLPIATLATLGNLAYGSVDWVVGGLLAISLMFGAMLGARFAHTVRRSTLREVLAWVLVLVGLLLLLRILWLQFNFA